MSYIEHGERLLLKVGEVVIAHIGSDICRCSGSTRRSNEFAAGTTAESDGTHDLFRIIAPRSLIDGIAKTL